MKKKSLPVFQLLINIVLLFCVLIIFTYITLRKLDLSLDFSILLEYRKQFLSGFVMTLFISACTLILSLFIGIITAFCTNSHIIFLSYLCRLYVQFIRGTPLLVQIFFFYYIIGTAWGINNRYIAGIIILSIFEGAYISEIIRGGLNSIDTLQYEISTAIGLNHQQRFFLVLLPQLVIRIMPALAGQFASIIKDSSLLSVIAVIELTQTTQEISAINYALFENYLFLGLLYFTLTLPVFLLSQYLEKRFAYAH
ncbi:polar amino acid transport system permease protein [Brevinema andersonii]|uniref:Polar amino acid transport system permease protein n=1 Tax=Brevinema andersonii TaxID=34097 RepID=A0A1I1FFW2_BREAD|nr:amino acid ABC transporter permease [Brevinema andersonii]SFB96588.1 polar amino acid transport system permease protein [Brevinema andersonii]